MNHRPKVLFLNRSYWPDVEATGQLLTELCESLHSSFDVSIVAGQPNQVRDTNQVHEWQKESVRNGVRIHRITHSQSSKSRMLLKAMNYISFVSAPRRFLRTCEAPDVVVFETDPFLLPFEAYRLRKRTEMGKNAGKLAIFECLGEKSAGKFRMVLQTAMNNP